MRFSPPLIPARFVERINRFAARVEVAGQEVVAHVPNSGRMTELLVRGAAAQLSAVPARSSRKTPYDLTLIRYGEEWVGVDARLPNVLFAEAFQNTSLPDVLDSFDGYERLQREVRIGPSRFDFLLSGPRGSCVVETKSVNLVEKATALFPDAPTLRGVRHVEALIALHRDGFDTALVFIVQRADAVSLSPHGAADPAFAAAVRAAAAAGVRLLAYTCRVSPWEIAITGSIPVVLS